MSNSFPPTRPKIKSLEQMLGSTRGELGRIIRATWKGELPAQLTRDISLFSKQDQINWNDINYCWLQEYNEESRSAFKLKFFFAQIYLHNAENAYEENLPEESYFYLFKASRFIGFLEGYNYRLDEEETRTKRASKGGKKLDQKKQLIREKIIELIKNRPKTKSGRESELAIAKDISTSQELTTYISKIHATETIKDLNELVIQTLIDLSLEKQPTS